MNDRKNMRLAAVMNEPWLVLPSVLDGIASNFRAFASVFPDYDQPQIAENGKRYTVVNDIAVIRAEGLMVYKAHRGVSCWGMVSTDMLEAAIRDATADSAALGIMLVIDSPGGQVTGTPEAAKALFDARSVKPVFAYNDGQMDSAAYWIGSQAHRIYATSSARTGSIGAYLAFMDFTAMLANEGIKIELFKSAPDKAMGLPGTSITDEQRATLQARVDTLGAQFISEIERSRNGISAEYMTGLDYDSTTAQGAWLIDGVKTLPEAMGELSDIIKAGPKE